MTTTTEYPANRYREDEVLSYHDLDGADIFTIRASGLLALCLGCGSTVHGDRPYASLIDWCNYVCCEDAEIIHY